MFENYFKLGFSTLKSLNFQGYICIFFDVIEIVEKLRNSAIR